MATVSSFPDPVAGSSHTAADSTVRILVLGKKGSGKSSSGNTIVGQKVFSSPKRYKEKVTKTCEEHTCHVGGKKVCVIDTPDLLDPDVFGDELHRETDKLVSLCQAGLHAVLLVVPIGEELQNEEEMLEFMKALLGPNIQKFIIVLFTRGDELEEDETIEQHIQDTKQGKELEMLIERCCGHFHVFNNRELVEDQVTGLLDKIHNLVKSNEGVFLMGHTRRISMDCGIYFSEDTKETGTSEVEQLPERKEQRRLVLLGKTGVGKSATGNTILGRNVFKSEPSSTSQTQECSTKKIERNGKQIVVIDTPGLFDTKLSQEDVITEIVKCMTYSSPGPHAFLIVIKIGRFTPEEKETMKQIKEVFGANTERFSMILFTCKDELKKQTIQEYLEDGDPELKALVESCANRYYCVNNNAVSYTQFKTLMEIIESMLAGNEGKHFTAESFQGLEQSILEVQNEKLKEKLKSYSQEQRKQTEWEKIYWQLLEESRSEAQEVLISDLYFGAVAKLFRKIQVTTEERESAIKAAESKGVNRRKAVGAAIKATGKLARQKMCRVQ